TPVTNSSTWRFPLWSQSPMQEDIGSVLRVVAVPLHVPRQGLDAAAPIVSTTMSKPTELPHLSLDTGRRLQGENWHHCGRRGSKLSGGHGIVRLGRTHGLFAGSERSITHVHGQHARCSGFS